MNSSCFTRRWPLNQSAPVSAGSGKLARPIRRFISGNTGAFCCRYFLSPAIWRFSTGFSNSVMTICWHGLELPLRFACTTPLRGFLSRRAPDESDARAIFPRRKRHMTCIYCRADTEVINSRLQHRSNQVWRRRRCRACGAVFTTHEAVDLASTLMVDSEGSVAPFLADKLYSDLLAAMQDRPDRYTAAREATATVIKRLLSLPDRPVFTATQISAASGAVLSKLDRRAWLRYAAEHPSLQQ